jgi:hypothetical protein
VDESGNLPANEEEWLTSPEPGPMLRVLRGSPGARKWRLFAVACCRRVWDGLTDPRSRRAVEAAERHADGLATDDELAQAWRAAWDASLEIPEPQDPARRAAAEAARACAWPVEEMTADEAFKAAWFAAFTTTGLPARTMGAERSAQCALLRDLLGNPFRPVAVDPAWLAWDGGRAPRLARAIFEERRFDQLRILADALEEAGCDDASLLTHCRGPGPHVRGCWVVDLILGKA